MREPEPDVLHSPSERIHRRLPIRAQSPPVPLFVVCVLEVRETGTPCPEHHAFDGRAVLLAESDGREGVGGRDGGRGDEDGFERFEVAESFDPVGFVEELGG